MGDIISPPNERKRWKLWWYHIASQREEKMKIRVLLYDLQMRGKDEYMMIWYRLRMRGKDEFIGDITSPRSKRKRWIYWWYYIASKWEEKMKFMVIIYRLQMRGKDEFMNDIIRPRNKRKRWNYNWYFIAS